MKNQHCKDVSAQTLHNIDVLLDNEMKAKAPITLSTFVSNAMKQMEDDKLRILTDSSQN